MKRKFNEEFPQELIGRGIKPIPDQKLSGKKRKKVISFEEIEDKENGPINKRINIKRDDFFDEATTSEETNTLSSQSPIKTSTLSSQSFEEDFNLNSILDSDGESTETSLGGSTETSLEESTEASLEENNDPFYMLRTPACIIEEDQSTSGSLEFSPDSVQSYEQQDDNVGIDLDDMFASISINSALGPRNFFFSSSLNNEDDDMILSTPSSRIFPSLIRYQTPLSEGAMSIESSANNSASTIYYTSPANSSMLVTPNQPTSGIIPNTTMSVEEGGYFSSSYIGAFNIFDEEMSS